MRFTLIILSFLTLIVSPAVHAQDQVNVSPSSSIQFAGTLPETKKDKMARVGDTNVVANAEDTALVVPSVTLPGITVPEDVTWKYFFGDFYMWVVGLLISLFTYLSGAIPTLNKLKNHVRWISVGVVVIVGSIVLGVPEWKAILTFLVSGGGYSVLSLLWKPAYKNP